MVGRQKAPALRSTVSLRWYATGTYQYLEYLFYAYFLCILLFVFARAAHSLATAPARTERHSQASSGILAEAPASARFQFGDGRLQVPVHRPHWLLQTGRLV